MTRTAVLAAIAAFVLAAPAYAQHAPAQGEKSANLQGDPGPFADKKTMMPFFNILLEAHNQGEKADLPAMEAKIRTLVPALMGGKSSKAMEDHVLGVAHQALALGVSNPKMFESYETFMAAMMGPS